MAPKTRAPRGKKKNQVAVTKAMEKNKTCRRLLNSALAAPSHSLTPGSRRKKQVLRSVKAGLHFSICRIGRYLKEGRYYQRIGFGAPVYLVVVLEYLTAKVLGLARQAAKESKKICTIPRHAMLGVMRGEELSKLMAGVTIAHSSVLPSIHESLFGDGTTEDTAKLPTKDVAKSPKNIAKSS